MSLPSLDLIFGGECVPSSDPYLRDVLTKREYCDIM